MSDTKWMTNAALKFKIPMGKIACPHCGMISSGAITPRCPTCNRRYFDKEEK